MSIIATQIKTGTSNQAGRIVWNVCCLIFFMDFL